MQNKKVIAAGHICLDITPVIPPQKQNRIEDIFIPGTLIQTEGVSISTGGSVANTGLALKKLGADVSLVGKIGSDEFGDMICDILKKYDAEKDMIKTSDYATSYTVVLAAPGIDRIFLHCPGANSNYYAADINEDLVKDAALFHFGYPTVMESMFENEGEELLKLMEKVKSFGCATSLDLTLVDDNSKAGSADWKTILKKVVPFVDFFVPSIEELCFILDKERFRSWQKRDGGEDLVSSLDFEKDIKPLADECMVMGCRVLLLKCGAKGLYLQTASENALRSVSPRLGLNVSNWANKAFFVKSFKPETVLSATGAGDTSIAAFLTSMLNGLDPKECVELAAATGACCVAAYDSLSGLKPLEELKQKIAAGWEHIE